MALTKFAHAPYSLFLSDEWNYITWVLRLHTLDNLSVVQTPPVVFNECQYILIEYGT